MDTVSDHPSSFAETFATAAFLIGVSIAVLPFVFLPVPGPSQTGPIGFAVVVMYGLTISFGLGVATAGLYTVRSGNPKPAVAAATAGAGLSTVGLLGYIVEQYTRVFLVPIWAWVLSVLLVLVVTYIVTNRVASKRP